MIRVDFNEEMDKLTIEAEYKYLDVIRGIPHRRYSKEDEIWYATLTRRNIEYLQNVGASFSMGAEDIADNIMAGNLVRFGKLPLDWQFKLEPLNHQMEALLRAIIHPSYALLMDPGTGKTKILIDDSAYAFGANLIDCVIVIVPNTIKSNWYDEIDKHTNTPADVCIYNSKKKKETDKWRFEKHGDHIPYLVIGVESFSAGGAYDLVRDIVLTRRCSILVDESSKIKNHKSNRTDRIIQLGRICERRRIATGTPITKKGPEHLWAQYEFLDPNILNHSNFYSFRNRYCVVVKRGGKGHTKKFKKVIGGQNEDELMEVITPNTYRISLDEAAPDLPKKIYQTRLIEPSKEMEKLYKELKDEQIVRIDGKKMSYKNALTRDLRLQQITGGFLSLVPDKNQDENAIWGSTFVEVNRIESGEVKPIPGKNPKIEEIKELVTGELRGKGIIWCRFIPEIVAVTEMLEELELGEVVRYQGQSGDHGMSDEERTASRQRFQEDDDVQFFVGQISSGGYGITLTEAKWVIYLSNTFSLEDRIQSEERAHRLGLKHPVLYIELLMNRNWVDKNIKKSIDEKMDYSDYINKMIEDSTKVK